MSLNEKAILTINEYFAELAQNAVNIAYGECDEDTTFEEFIENLTNYIHLLSSEHVASEVLDMSSSKISNFNNGSGITVEDVQSLIDQKEDGLNDEEDEDEGEVNYEDD